MTPSLSKKLASLAAVLALVVLLPTATLAESTKVEGVIVGRSGSEIIVEYMQGSRAGVSAGRRHEGGTDGRIVQGAADRQVDGGADSGPEGQG